MTDLFVLTADADALAVMNAVLARPGDLGIRPVSFRVDRHFGRDPGVVKDGPELARMKAPKREFSKVILLWDHQGSGWEPRFTPAESEARIQARLDGVSWKDHSCAIALAPELEAWLCQDSSAIARFLGVGERACSPPPISKRRSSGRSTRVTVAVPAQTTMNESLDWRI